MPFLAILFFVKKKKKYFKTIILHAFTILKQKLIITHICKIRSHIQYRQHNKDLPAWLCRLKKGGTLSPKKIWISASKTEPVTAGADTTGYVRLTYSAGYLAQKTRQILLRRLQPRKARFLCGHSDYFWDNARCVGSQEMRFLMYQNMTFKTRSFSVINRI